MTVRGLVEMGRYPLVGPWRRYGARTTSAVARALATMRIEDLPTRQVGRAVRRPAAAGPDRPRPGAGGPRAAARRAVRRAGSARAGAPGPAAAGSGRQRPLVVASHHDLKTVGDIFDEVVLLNGTLIAHGRQRAT